MIEEITGVPVAGVMPYLHVDIDDEDSLSDRLAERRAAQAVDIAVMRLPHISNFTDFNPLELVGGVSVRYVGRVCDFERRPCGFTGHQEYNERSFVAASKRT